MQFTLSCPCLFGLESVLKGEIQRLGGEEIQVSDGRVTFRGDEALLARASICLRTAERLQIIIGSFRALSFEELFEGTRALNLEDYIGKKDAFPVKGWSVNSKLFSVSDCQSIIKKAVCRRLESVYGISWFEETGPVHQLQFSIMKDEVTLMLDASGVGLHKRGYRAEAMGAPIKETLAAGILDLLRIYPDTQLYDPMCGSGTLLIEGAMHALRIPPGLRRNFTAQKWGLFPERVWDDERATAYDAVRRDATFFAWGSDIDEEALAIATQNAKKADVHPRISLKQQDLREFATQTERACIVCNPPYGERLLDIKEAERLYREMGRVFEKRPQHKYAIITPDENFEDLFGRKADKRRKLYNGMIRCTLYMYL